MCYKHVNVFVALTEVITEKQILQEQCQKMLSHHRELSKIAEDLSSRMTVSVQAVTSVWVPGLESKPLKIWI